MTFKTFNIEYCQILFEEKKQWFLYKSLNLSGQHFSLRHEVCRAINRGVDKVSLNVNGDSKLLRPCLSKLYRGTEKSTMSCNSILYAFMISLNPDQIWMEFSVCKVKPNECS